jgi:hypothetical protein
MVVISMKTSSPRAIAWARKMMESKRQIQAEIREGLKSPEIKAIFAELKRKRLEKKLDFAKTS